MFVTDVVDVKTAVQTVLDDDAMLIPVLPIGIKVFNACFLCPFPVWIVERIVNGPEIAKVGRGWTRRRSRRLVSSLRVWQLGNNEGDGAR